MRIRTIKPEFWLHEDLSQLTPLARLTFIGLWQIADRDGRLENRPRRIKASLFPYDNTNVEAVIDELIAHDFIQKYEVNGDHFLAIPGFSEHQRPHPKEPQSLTPPPPSRVKKRRAVERFSSIPSSPVGREGKGMDNGKEHLQHEVGGHQEIIDSLVLIFETEKHSEYEFSGRDATAVKNLRAKFSKAEIETRFLRALRLTHPPISNIFELAEARHWNRCAADSPQPRNGKGPIDPATQHHVAGDLTDAF